MDLGGLEPGLNYQSGRKIYPSLRDENGPHLTAYLNDPILKESSRSDFLPFGFMGILYPRPQISNCKVLIYSFI